MTLPVARVIAKRPCGKLGPLRYRVGRPWCKAGPTDDCDADAHSRSVARIWSHLRQCWVEGYDWSRDGRKRTLQPGEAMP